MEPHKMQPMPLLKSILYFGIPGTILYATVYLGMPFLLELGAPMFWIFVGIVIVFGALLFNLSTNFACREEHSCSLRLLAQRFRLVRMTGRMWLWTLGLIAFSAATALLLQPTTRWLAQIPYLAPPDFIPAVLNPLASPPSGPPELMGVPLRGNWWIVPVWIVMLTFNIFGEEFWWRGYILPRQELVHGKWTWLIHGILWNLFHFVWKWNLITLLPMCLALPYVVQKTRNTWVGVIAHFVLNGVALIPISAAVLS